MSSQSVNLTSEDFKLIFPDSTFEEKNCFKAGSLILSTDCMIQDDTFKVTPLKAVCQYRECLTVNSEVCKFPFRYKGRMFDACITVDSSVPWCSLKTDVDFNHIDEPETKGNCPQSCPVAVCPVGYFLFNGNCLSFSGRSDNDAWESVEQSNQYCLETGARLYQPRDIPSIEHLKLFESEYVKPEGPHFQHKTISSVLSIGGISTSLQPKVMINYLDGSRGYVYEKIMETDGVLTNTITNFELYEKSACLMMNQEGKLSVDECLEYNSLLATEIENNGNMLGYICEAKHIVTVGGPDAGKACHFPFRAYEGESISQTCIFDYINEGAWCATEVNSDGIMIPGKWGSCEDERAIAYRGKGAGKECIFPFLHDRVWYSHCVLEPREEHWCPTSLGASQEFVEDVDEFGYCTEFSIPTLTECPLNYEKVGGKCIRVSPYPEDFSAGQAKCQTEGANLLSIMDDKLTNILKVYIINLESTRSYFHPSLSPDLTSYWIGGSARNLDWSWLGSGKNFSGYSNWVDETPNKGCIQLMCTDNYGLSIQVEKRFKWMAEDKSKVKPYICESVCRLGYHWHKNIKRCLKIVPLNEGKTRAGAMLACAEENSRLLSVRYCDDLQKIGKDAFVQLKSSQEHFWLGYFGGEFKTYKPDRITNLEEGTIDARGYLSPSNCNLIDQTIKATVLAAQKEYSGYLFYKSDSAIDVSLGVAHFKDLYDNDIKGFICEPENEWTCPSQYIMFQEECYKFVNTSKLFNEALLECQTDNGELLKVQYSAHFHFLYEYLRSVSAETLIWAGYRRNILSATEDKTYLSSNLQEDLAIIAGKFQIHLY